MTRSIPLLPLVIALGTLLTTCSISQAQRSSKLPDRNARRLGLTTVWSKTISTGYAGGISGVEVYVSPVQSYQGSEVVDKYGRRVFFSARATGQPTSRAGYNQTTRLADLKRAELEARGLAPQVEVKQIPDVTLYVRSTLGTVTALDAETGKQKWTSQAGTPGYPSYGTSSNDEYVVTISGSTVYLLDAETGQVLDSVPATDVPAGTPVIDGGLIYVPTTRGLIDVLSVDDLGRREFTLGAGGRIDNSITTSPASVSWVTDMGHVYVANVGEPGIIYRFQSMAKMAAKPVYMDETLFAVSLDGFVYAINEAHGELKWTYAAGGPVRDAPVAVDGSLYLTTTEGQMTVIDASTGKAKWVASHVQSLISVSDTRVYCVSPDQRLTVLDRNTGGRLGASTIRGMGTPVVNPRTDRIYLVTDTGVLQCLRESGKRWPTARKPPVREQADKPASDTKEALLPDSPDAPSAQRQPAVEPDADPFGDLGNDPEAGEPDPEVDDSTPAQEDLGDPFGAGEDSGSDDGGFGDADGEMDDDGGDPFAF